jgi:hypothetical protein
MGLRSEDLKDLVHRIYEVDSYKSKMGEDKDIVVLSFSCLTEASAKDLMNFIEKGYPFVLDADTTSGEQSDGTYKVFVELEREKRIPEQILEIIDGVQKVAGIPEMKFRYYKSFKSMPSSMETLGETIPLDKEAYEVKINENHMDNVKNFFSKSYVDSVDLVNESTLVMKKIWADAIRFNVIDFGKTEDISKTVTESYNINSFPEIVFLTKYIGDFDIEKYGDKFLIENNGYSLVLTRL